VRKKGLAQTHGRKSWGVDSLVCKSKIHKNMAKLKKKGQFIRREDIVTERRSGAIFKYTDADLNKITAERNRLETKLNEQQKLFRDLVFSNECIIEIKIKKNKTDEA